MLTLKMSKRLQKLYLYIVDVLRIKCLIAGLDESEELLRYSTLRDENKQLKENSKRDDNLNDILRSNDSDLNSDGSNNMSRSINIGDEDFDTENEFRHRRLGKIHSREAFRSQRCEVGSVWEINCFNCFCGLNGRPSCDKIADCSLLPYGNCLYYYR